MNATRLSLFASSILFIATQATLYSEETLVYKKDGGRELNLFVEKPADWKASDRHPAIVFFFGGGWVGGTP